MGCCPNNVNPIPPTQPPVPPVEPPVPPDYEYPEGFVIGVDQMILADRSGIRLIDPDTGGSNDFDGISYKDSSVWFEFEIPLDNPNEWYLQFNFVEYATTGSGSTDVFAYPSWRTASTELYETVNPGSQITITASTDGSFGDAQVSKGEKLYYRLRNANPNVDSAGFRLSWGFTKL